MKDAIELVKYKLAFFAMAFLSTAYAFAQEGEGVLKEANVEVTSTSTTTTSTDWYTQPWVWIVGALVFIILLAAIIGGNRSTRVSDGTTVRKTTVTRTDTYDA